MATFNLSARDIDDIGRVVDTEVSPAGLSPMEYNRMVAAVVDTITNRLAKGKYGKTVREVVDQKNAFSAIHGPKSKGRVTVAQARAPSTRTSQIVGEHLKARAAGQPSEIAGQLDYANPNYSDKKNMLGWVSPMINAGATALGIGKNVHYHGLAPGNYAAPDYSISLPSDFMPDVGPNLTRSLNVGPWGRTLPTPNAKPSPDRPDNRNYAGPKGTFNAGYSAPRGAVQRGGPLAPASQPASRAAVTKGYQDAAKSMATGGVKGVGYAPARTASPLSAAPAGNVTRSPLGPAKSAPSPARPDNANYAGPKGNFSVTPTGQATKAQQVEGYGYAAKTKALAPASPMKSYTMKPSNIDAAKPAGTLATAKAVAKSYAQGYSSLAPAPSQPASVPNGILGYGAVTPGIVSAVQDEARARMVKPATYAPIQRTVVAPPAAPKPTYAPIQRTVAKPAPIARPTPVARPAPVQRQVAPMSYAPTPRNAPVTSPFGALLGGLFSPSALGGGRGSTSTGGSAKGGGYGVSGGSQSNNRASSAGYGSSASGKRY